ncbi:PRTRC system protein D [Duganella sp. FT92W]|uniref:PRTRC system protein D n=1 Tax=Pseudoduganella rivuli TaxID=2666085 RepID=A0A7X2IID9_9BURK|nr:PRTRC system protein D [Pseudoduganella rivuli]MRV70594.1 PRTRC system protein D [Pseudoduganella rivuli]
MEQIVRAVDVGRGNTKFVVTCKDGIPKCEMFPSEAHPTETQHLQEGWGAKRRTIGIPVGDLIYEVGPDVHLAADVFNANVLQHDRYCETDEYLALLLGALYYMNVERIDLLIIGVPVASFKLKKLVSLVEKRVEGEHALAAGRRIRIAKARVIAQPSGALMSYGLAHNRLAEIRKERSLIVDPGRRTFDWLVTQGMHQVEKRSNSVNRGMFDVLQSIADGIGRATNSQFRDYDLIDTALRTRKNPVIFQKEYDISQHLPLARKIPEQAVAEMMHYVGDAGDIRNIILVGGGAFFFKPALKTAFPQHAILELREPLYANVKGFQYAGLDLAKSLTGAAPQSGAVLDAIAEGDAR